MRRVLSPAILCAALTVAGHAQNPAIGPALEAMLNFELEHQEGYPRGWIGGPRATISVDGEIVHNGRWSARIERTAESAGDFSALTMAVPVEFAGEKVEWRGYLRSDSVSDFMGLWMRQDGDTPNLSFTSMQPRQIKGTSAWTEYSIDLPVHSQATELFVGVLLGGTGKVWVDDLQLLVDGKPVWEARRRDKTPLDEDHEFDNGSRIVVTTLSKVQIENLTRLGKVWGFLKYHHPAVTSGQRHWDYELFRVLPRLLAASDRQAGNRIMLDWARGLGPAPPCSPCATLQDEDLHLRPDIEWIREDSLGRELSQLLGAVHRDRSRGRQFYVSQVPNVGNPRFDHEPYYLRVSLPDAGYQLLALYRLWNIIEYWFPYRDQLDEDWDRVLTDFIPRMMQAKDKAAYQLETLALIARVDDTHANLRTAPPQVHPPSGDCQLAVTTRFVEKQAVVTGYSNDSTGPATGLKIGDVVESLDGVSVAELVKRWEPYYPASNQAARLRNVSQSLTRGPCSAAAIAVRRDALRVQLEAVRQPLASLNLQSGFTHDRSGETFQLLSDQVAYLKLSSVRMAQAASYVDRARNTRGLIIDIRNYPSEFMVFALGSLLVERPTPFARFTAGDLDNPGAFRWGAPLALTPQQPHYAGKIVILVDETSISQSEYTAMAFRSAPQAVVVGSTTAGADGNVSPFSLPGGLATMISGIGVFYPDKRPTQRVGIVPDIEVRPTIAGIRAGRDEVLEEAVRQILGRAVPSDQIEKMARPRF